MDTELNPTMSGGTEEVVTSETANSDKGVEAGNADRQEDERKFNAAMAAARRRAEKETEDKMNLRFDDTIRDMQIPNPEKPGECFTSRKELEAYTAKLKLDRAAERAEKTGKTTQEVLDEDANREYIKKLREREEKATASGKDEQTEFLRADIEDFRARHPDVDIAKLDGNKAFRRFVGSRYGKEPLADLYDDYTLVVGEVKAAEAVRREDRSARSTGSGGSGSAAGLTAAQRSELKRWNENFPEMKMTEAEFLNRGK